MYLIDTNILSELMKKKPSPSFMVRLGRIPSAALYTASVCIMELRYGALKRGNPPDLWPRIEEQILSRLRILSFSLKEAIKAGELINQLYSIGQPVGVEDIIIASIALCNGLILVTANTKHFSRIPELKVENWIK